ncbi:MAG: D-glycero-alpha-D-manno-heptose-1,7-bisphosphate 7-phosphatase [Gemmatimonadota bacterium]
MNGIVFLDRDGTLIEEEGYLSDPARLREIPGAAESLGRLVRGGYLIAVVSNQAGLAKGKFGRREMEAVHRAFVAHFRDRGVAFDGVEYCPHHPEGVVEEYRLVCGCRKPATGMAERVLARLSVPASCRRWMVGDKMSDVLMGRGLGAATILVATGYGERERVEMERHGLRADLYVPSIREAVDRILSGEDVT